MEAIALIIRVITAIIKALSFCWIFLWVSSVVVVSCSFITNSTKILYFLENAIGLEYTNGLELNLIFMAPFVILPIIILVVIGFVEKAVYGGGTGEKNNTGGSILNYTVKGFISVLTAVVSGVIVWVLTK